MAIFYVRSGATGAANGTSWTDAYTTLSGAAAAVAATDDIYVAHDHAEVNASSTAITFSGASNTVALRIMSVHTGTGVPTPGASISVTSGSLTITGVNIAYYGITFNVSSGGTSGNFSVSTPVVFNSCNINMNGANSSSTLLLNGSAFAEFINVNYSHASNSGRFAISSGLRWRGGAVVANIGVPSAIPTPLITSATNRNTPIIMEGVDLSLITTSARYLFGDSITTNTFKVSLIGCKLGTDVTIMKTPGNTLNWCVDVTGCDHGTAFHRNERYAVEGTTTTDTTAYLTGGASNGTNNFSHKIVSGAAIKPGVGYDSIPLAIWNETTGSKTITVEVATSGVTLTDNDIFMEVFYFGSSTSTQHSRTTTQNASLISAGTNLTSSSATWNGIGSVVKQKMSATINVQKRGYIKIGIRVLKPSTTIWVDPNITVT